MAHRPRIAVEPNDFPTRPWLVAAVEAGGGEVVAPEDAEALVWAANTGVDALRAGVAQAANATWIQLPFAGVEPFVAAFDREHTWTSGKGVYAEPVAELVLTLALAGLHRLQTFIPATTWQQFPMQKLRGANVVILGGGTIAEALLRLLAPFDCRVTVLRRHPQPMDGAAHVASLEELNDGLPDADLVVLALALSPETEGVIGADQLARMKRTAWLVNVARGRHVDTDALVDALRDHRIGGAALDVFPVEPLPDDHPLWGLDNCIVLPHVGTEQSMAERYLAPRIAENVRRFAAGEPLLGVVDVDLGY